MGKTITDTELIDWMQRQDGCAIISDDEGHWAFVEEGVQNINMSDTEEPFDLQTVYWVEKHAFKPTIREAVTAAIRLEEDLPEGII